jgi:hypothetical protein
MKKFIKIGLFLNLFLVNLYSCGCTDIPNASAGAKQINGTYDKNDASLSNKFEEQLNLVNEVMQNELIGHEQLTHTVTFEIDSILQLDNLNFELLKNENIIKINK